MSIQDTRIALLTNALLKKNLQKGLLPDSKEFIWQLEQALTLTGKNDATFRFKPYRKTEIATAQRLNQDHALIHQDLEILYKNLLTLYGGLNKEFQYFITEKGKLEKHIDILENRLQHYLQNMLRMESQPYAYDVFDDTSKVDLTQTHDIIVDTQNNETRLVEEKKTTRRIYPEGAVNFTLFPSQLDLRETTITGQLTNTLQPIDDAIWQKQVRLMDNQPLTGVITYNFKETWSLNQIDIQAITIKPFALQITYSIDGLEWFDLPNYVETIQTEKQVTVHFPSIPMKHIRLELIKSEADEIISEQDGYDYHYLFGLESIAFYHKQYPVEGVLQSKPLTFYNEPTNYAIEEITLVTDEWLPTGTNIEYEIALAQDSLDWQAIDPINRKHPVHPQTLSLMRMQKNGGEALYFSKHYSAQQAEAEDLIANGLPLYRLTQLRHDKEFMYLPPRRIRENSMRLYVGQKNWQVTSFPSQDVSGIPSVTDFKGLFPNTRIQYQQLLEGKDGDVFRQLRDAETHKYLATISLYMSEPRTITARPVSTDPYAIYINGDLIHASQPEDDKDVHYVFRSGWNDLTVLVNGQHATAVNGITVLLGFQLSNLTETIYSSSQPLKEIELFDLQYNTKRNERTVFAKREVTGGWEILTNFWAPGLSFMLYYDYKSEDLPESDQLLLRARFSREDGLQVPTPVLRSYRLECT